MTNGTIVVGADGSLESAGAIRWSYQLAHSLGASVHVLQAWQLTTGGVLSPTKTGEDYRRQAELELERAVELAGDAPVGVDVTVQLVQHEPALALVGAAEEAMMLVVGSHSYGDI